MIGSFSTLQYAIGASDPNSCIMTPGVHECFQPDSIIQEVLSDVCMTVA